MFFEIFLKKFIFLSLEACILMWRVLNYRQIKTLSACIVLILSPETNDGGELKKILIILVLLGVALAASGKAVHTLLPFAADLYLRKAGFCLG